MSSRNVYSLSLCTPFCDLCPSGCGCRREGLRPKASVLQGVPVATDGPLHTPQEVEVSATHHPATAYRDHAEISDGSISERNGVPPSRLWSSSYSPYPRRSRSPTASSRRRSPSPARPSRPPEREEKRRPPAAESDRLKKLKEAYGDASARDDDR